jgi:hypothetical protein
MCKDNIPGSISMIVDSGASRVLVRQEHAHVLQNDTCDNSKSYATIKCAKQGAEFANRYFRLNHTACLQPILVGYKYHRPTLWRVTIPPPKQDTITIPRAIADDLFLVHSHDNTTTANLRGDEILDRHGSSSAPAPTLKRTPIYAYRDFSYAADDYVTSGTYKVPLVHKIIKNPNRKQRVPPSREQRVL